LPLPFGGEAATERTLPGKLQACPAPFPFRKVCLLAASLFKSSAGVIRHRPAAQRKWPPPGKVNGHQRKITIVNINDHLLDASTISIYPAMNLGKFRGIWRDQIFADDDITGDEFKVMYAIESFMRKGKTRNGKTEPDNRTPKPGNTLLADRANVSEMMVRRALAKAALRGHLHIMIRRRDMKPPRVFNKKNSLRVSMMIRLDRPRVFKKNTLRVFNQMPRVFTRVFI
jgi:hypothetical protein